MPFPETPGAPWPGDTVPTCVPKAKMCAWIFFDFFFKAVCALQEPHLSHLGLEYNCAVLINSFSFPSEVEAGAHGYKLNTNPLWARILRTIKTKSTAAGGRRHRAKPSGNIQSLPRTGLQGGAQPGY